MGFKKYYKPNSNYQQPSIIQSTERIKQQMSFSISQASQSRRQHIKKFQSRVLNRSCADFMFYDKLADYMLECCSAQAKPNTLSVFSLIPLIICNSIISPGQWWSFLISIIAILMHQILDIANKKQAYRLSQFNLTTYYLDHLYDSISAVMIVDITGKLLMLENETRFTCVFFFAMLPFYTHHLAMYTTGYLTFYNLSPAVEGLMILQILFLICTFFPSLPNIQVFMEIKLSQFIVFLAMLWLIIFLIDDLRTILRMKKQQISNNLIDNLPVKNLFVIGVLGYVMMEMTMVAEFLLDNQLFMFLSLSTLTLMFTFIISTNFITFLGELILSYGFQQKHRQFTLNTLTLIFWIVVFYSVCGLAKLQQDFVLTIGQIVFGALFAGQLFYFFYYHYQNVKFLNIVIKNQ